MRFVMLSAVSRLNIERKGGNKNLELVEGCKYLLIYFASPISHTYLFGQQKDYCVIFGIDFLLKNFVK